MFVIYLNNGSAHSKWYTLQPLFRVFAPDGSEILWSCWNRTHSESRPDFLINTIDLCTSDVGKTLGCQELSCMMLDLVCSYSHGIFMTSPDSGQW